jgi:hypothetical protein
MLSWSILLCPPKGKARASTEVLHRSSERRLAAQNLGEHYSGTAYARTAAATSELARKVTVGIAAHKERAGVTIWIGTSLKDRNV